MANLCEKAGVDIKDVSYGMGSDQRIAERFLRAGPAYGGSCFPKDTRAVLDTAKSFKVDLSIIKNVIKSNENRKILLTKKLMTILNGNLKNKSITFLGVTFKPNTDDMREASSLYMIPYLSKKVSKIRYFDPSGEKKDFSSKWGKDVKVKLSKVSEEELPKYLIQNKNKYNKNYNNVMYCNNIESACNKSDLIVIHTEWNEFKFLNFKRLVKKSNFKIYDMRNVYSPSEMKKKKINYFAIGR